MTDTICSWDVGTKNLAYCLLQYDKTNKDNIKIIKWDVIDLRYDDINKKTCNKDNCNINPKQSCIYDNKEYRFCGRHKKSFEDYKLKTGWENGYIEKITNKENCNNCNKNAYYKDLKNNTFLCAVHRKSYLNKIEKDNKPKKIKKIKCNQIPPDVLSKNLYNKLNLVPELLNVQTVLIENQPSFKNALSKSISCYIYAYYMLKGVIDINESKLKTIKYCSPTNKLNIDKENTKKVLAKADGNKRKEYDLTKELGEKYTKKLLQKTNNSFWENTLNKHKKKDDLCDAFLQAYHYITK